MLTLTLLSLALAGPTTNLATTPAPQRSKSAPPPGMVLIEGGRTKIGSPLKDIEKKILEEPEAEQRARSLLAETPQHTQNVDPFFLMVSEVTNEQYAVYVEASGSKPPEHWGVAAIDAARAAFVEAQGRLKREAKEAGEKPPESRKFDTTEWWDKNWKGTDWEIPKGEERFPVIFVSYEDAKGYARWAGLRLPYEAEFQRAVRGDKDRLFPWGDDFDASKAATSEAGRRGEPYPIAKFPDGATEEGVYDLIGNVWEWTLTPYTAYDGFKPLKITIGRGKQKRSEIVETPWDPNDRIVVGGSFQNSALAARATTRRRLERFQTTEILGFRCAASPTPGSDIAQAVLDHKLPVQVRPDGENGKVGYRPELTLGLDLWRSHAPEDASATAEKNAVAASSSSAAQSSRGRDAAPPPPPGYAVIDGYDFVVFIPGSKLRSANQSNLRKSTVEEALAPLGVLATNQSLVSPELPAGVYMVSFRGSGEKKKVREPRPDPAPDEKDGGAPPPGQQPPQEEEVVEAAPGIEQVLGLDTSLDHYIFFDAEGTPVTAVPAETWSFARMNPGRAKIVNVDFTIGEGKEAVTVTEKWLHFETVLESLVSSKGFRFTLPLKLEDGVLEREWRRQK